MESQRLACASTLQPALPPRSFMDSSPAWTAGQLGNWALVSAPDRCSKPPNVLPRHARDGALSCDSEQPDPMCRQPPTIWSYIAGQFLVRSHKLQPNPPFAG
ncbi:hypothetical protein PMIN01_06854 [Paraphaeosphaeria minitans]|uniref:Uncharacterized protein n=1 Tax=Paraphaeosphaeria minitans TaxID=565426 RepID=A0A9P6GHF5_9PLEO|nr:hypothetical protein PMIN01_06854 [Paraphaeosphaeria minitans]